MSCPLEVNELTNTDRGEGGFGSTGVNEQRTFMPVSDTADSQSASSAFQVKRLSNDSVITT